VVEAVRLQGLSYEYQLKETNGQLVDKGDWFEEDDVKAA
jgi:hypothetical protein